MASRAYMVPGGFAGRESSSAVCLGISSSHTTFAVRTHTVTIERLEKLRWQVSVDGRRFASFCSESRARAAGRREAQRLDLAAAETTQR